MQNKHTIIYFFGRGIPGLLSFLAITIYTRIINPEEYGRYALIITTISLMNMVLFQWIRLSLLRFLPKCETEADLKRLFSSLAAGFGSSFFLATLLLCIYMYVARPEQSLVYLYSFGLILLATEAFFELNLEYFRSNLMPVKYSLAFFFKAVLALGLGVILALSRFGALGMIVGIIVADVIAVLVFSRLFSMKLITGIRHFSVQHCKSLFLYGLPLSASFAMAFIVNSSDRFFINHYLGPASTGIYAVAYDFSNNSLSVIMYAINLASFPLAIRALEKGGEVLAREQLEKNLILLLSITIPVAVGMAIMSSEISSIFIGQAYSKDASIIIPLVAIGGLFIGFKNYYLDLAFQLGNKTYLQIWAVAFSAIVNILLNIFWIPKYGIIGAVYSTLACYIVSIAFSYKMSQRSFEMPMPFMKIIKIIISAVVMSMFIFILKPYFVDIYGFIVLVLAGGGIYVCCLIASKILDHNYLLLLGQRFLHKSSGK